MRSAPILEVYAHPSAATTVLPDSTQSKDRKVFHSPLSYRSEGSIFFDLSIFRDPKQSLLLSEERWTPRARTSYRILCARLHEEYLSLRNVLRNLAANLFPCSLSSAATRLRDDERLESGGVESGEVVQRMRRPQGAHIILRPQAFSRNEMSLMVFNLLNDSPQVRYCGFRRQLRRDRGRPYQSLTPKNSRCPVGATRIRQLIQYVSQL